mmetsp:Transcript_158/g.260  ORF Transcript_158/g.260 Transcript_158/m.260 type:complete len:107 (+) Transcript_158:1201-1521(+)
MYLAVYDMKIKVDWTECPCVYHFPRQMLQTAGCAPSRFSMKRHTMGPRKILQTLLIHRPSRCQSEQHAGETMLQFCESFDSGNSMVVGKYTHNAKQNHFLPRRLEQ